MKGIETKMSGKIKELIFVNQKLKKRISMILIGLTVVSLFLFTPIGQATVNKMNYDYFNDPKNYDVAEKVRFQKPWILNKKIWVFI